MIDLENGKNLKKIFKTGEARRTKYTEDQDSLVSNTESSSHHLNPNHPSLPPEHLVIIYNFLIKDEFGSKQQSSEQNLHLRTESDSVIIRY